MKQLHPVCTFRHITDHPEGVYLLILKLTRQITAFNTTQVHIGPEELAQLVVNSEGSRFAQATEEQHLSLSAVQSCPLDLRRALLHVGEVHVPVGDREGSFHISDQ